VNRARLRTTTAVTAAALSLSITPLIVESAWASSGGSTAASSSKRSSTHITRSGTGGTGNGTSSDEDADSAGEPRPSTNPKRTKSSSSGQKMHTKNTQKFQKVVLEELKKYANVGLSAKDLNSTFTSSGVLEGKGGAIRVTKAALSALEKKKAVEKIANSSPTKYKLTTAGLSLTSLRRKPLTTEELKDEIIELFERYQPSIGLSQREMFDRLDYAQGPAINFNHNDLLGQMVADGVLAFTPEGRYIRTQNVFRRPHPTDTPSLL
jgi:hypothetical protein